ncbi:MAG: CehA/McbA family metallohydrolase [Phycisphaerales bacterium]|nr:CehA/McbA family metallohydrolase [Phycisphaerales bacterium]
MKPSHHTIIILIASLVAASARAQKNQTRPDLPPDTVWADEANGAEFTADVPVGIRHFAEYPDIAAAGERVFVTWMEYVDGDEFIRFAEVTSGKPEHITTISADSERNCWPRLAADEQGRIWAAWSSQQGSGYRVCVRQVFPELAPTPTVLPAANESAPVNCFKPVIACTRSRTYVTWEQMTADTNRIVAVAFEDPQSPGHPFVVSGGGYAYRPALAAAADACWIAWDEVVDARQYEVFCARLEPDRVVESVRATRNPALDAAPGIALDADGRVWLAWHSDRSRTRQWDIPKWIQVRCYADGQWQQPPRDVPGAQDDPRGEDQGFEFPTLCFDSAQALWLFGRPSHGFNAVRFAGDAVSPVYRFAKPGWGGRGYCVRAVAVGDELWTVRRDLLSIVLARIKAPGGAAPVRGALRDVPPADLPKVAPPPGGFADPVVPHQSPAIPRVLFGDVHMHTALSDGMGTIDELYHRARHDYGYDFTAVTDHDDFVGNRVLPSEWAYMQAVTDLHDDPPHFATICAYEWTDARFPKGDGHKNVYYRDHGPLLWHTAPDAADGPKLFGLIDRAQGICFPHHIGWTGVNWKTHDERIEADVEICSVHGAYEYRHNTPIEPRGDMEGCFVQDGLNLGLRFGLVAGSDAHGLAWHHGIARRRNPWTHGLTGVYVDEPRRAAIWDALAARRCYATSGPKIVIDFKVAGHPAGPAAALTEPPTITASVFAPSRIDQLVLIRDGNAIFTSREDAETARIRFTDYNWPASGSAKAYYYLRVVLANNEMAWTSPVFVEFNAGGAPAPAEVNTNAPDRD